MFADYQCLVVREYRRKRKEGSLPLALVKPSPGKLKDACIRACEERFGRRDEQILKTYFGPWSDQQSCLQAISRSDIDIFRPLGNYLKGTTTMPVENVIELLAWLIDFAPRPFKHGEKYPSCTAEEETPTNTSAPEEPDRWPKNRKKAFPGRVKAATALILVILAICLYWLISNKNNSSQTCMYWAGDRYQPISCDGKAGGALIIPLDSGRMAHFRKITRTDTITENALGSIWYAKFQGTYECYTDSGFHPIDTSLKLKLLTDYVLLKHIRPGLHSDQGLPQ